MRREDSAPTADRRDRDVRQTAQEQEGIPVREMLRREDRHRSSPYRQMLPGNRHAAAMPKIKINGNSERTSSRTTGRADAVRISAR